MLDAAFAAAGCVLWAIVGVIIDGVQKGMAASAPRPEWRLAIVILCFVGCGLFGLMALAAIWTMLSMCCCGGGCCGGSGGRRSYRDVEAGKGGQFMSR